MSAPQKNTYIFQIYYDDATEAMLDPGFIPFNNRANTRPDWYEYWVIRYVLHNRVFRDDDYIGFFSPKFQQKTNLDSQQVFAAIQNSDAEIYSFTSAFDQGAKYRNPFVQGDVNHRGMIDITKEVLALLGIDLDIDNLVCDSTTTVFSNYFVARLSFWKEWFYYTEHLFKLCEAGRGPLRDKLLAVTGHNSNLSPSMKIFVLERLATVLLEWRKKEAQLCLDLTNLPGINPQMAEALRVADALKGQHRRTGQAIYLKMFDELTSRMA